MYRLLFIVVLATTYTAKLSAQSPTYVVLKPSASPISHLQGQPYYHAVHAQPYAYGYFGAQSPRLQRTYHYGYYDRHTQWNWR
jgi:hypothetical protein